MKLTFKHRPGYLFSLRVHTISGIEVVMSYSVDELLRNILINKKAPSGTITYSIFKSSRPCIGVKRADMSGWKITYSNIDGVEVGGSVRMCGIGFTEHVGAFKSRMFNTHYFIIETDEPTTVD